MKYCRRILALFLCVAALYLLCACGKTPAPVPVVSEGLEYRTRYDGTCEVVGIGTCEDTVVTVSEKSPAGDTVVAIAGYAFQNEAEITEVTLPSTVTEVGAYAFSGCSAMTAVTLPDAVVSIGTYAFSRCGAVKTVYLGASLTEIGDSAFHACNAIRYVFWRGAQSAWARVSVGANNSALTMAGTMYYYSATRPQAPGNWWCYNNGEIALWN